MWTWIIIAIIALVCFRGFSGKCGTNCQTTYTEEDVKRLIIDKQKIEAIKALRGLRNLGLKEAKDEVERMEAQMKQEGLLGR